MDLIDVDAIVTPRSIDELPTWQAGDGWLAGGTWLFSEPQPGLRRLVDLTGLGWPLITVAPAGIELAATCTIARLYHAALPADWPAAVLVGQCCRALLGSFKVWNMATVGGNLCMALPAGPMISLATALHGQLTIWHPDGGERVLPVTEFVLGPQRTALLPGELVRSITLPARALAARSAFRRASLNEHGRSAVLLIGLRHADGGFELTLTASLKRPLRLRFDALPDAAALHRRIEAIPLMDYHDDVHGRPDWRRHMTLRLALELRAELAA